MSDSSDRSFLPNSDAIYFNDNLNTSNHFNSNENYNDSQSSSAAASSCLKETGIVEKMLVSYGFIQCCERQARLFFHFSQFFGNIDHLKIGDPVEYETSYDRRTGKPVAINIKKIASNDFMTKLSKTERLSGVIATEITNEREGRVAFENMGEFFFLPFSRDDVVDNINFKANDKVSFVLTADDSGNYRATSVQLEASNLPCNQGVIGVIKDTFGFIERSDSMTKIFFHSSDCPNFKSLTVGDFVQFNITTRKNKELAINVAKQMNSDEEFSDKIYKGHVIKYNNRSSLASGFVFCSELQKEFFFYDKDVKGSFTMCPMDSVTFQIATDRRTQYQRAMNITFLPETFSINAETRERGYVASLKETYGFVKCPSKEGSLIYFKLAELIDPSIVLKLNDEVEFTYLPDAQSKKCQAIRISILPNGTIFNNIISRKSNVNHANVNQEEAFNPLIDLNPSIYDNEIQDTLLNDGITINGNGENSMSSTWHKELSDIFHTKNENDFQHFMNGNLELSEFSKENFDGVKKVGIIVVFKDNYGFIESIEGDNEYYFHINAFNDDNCAPGQSVEFDTLFSNGKWKALNVTPIENVIKHENDLSETFTGKVIRTLQVFENDQTEYSGLIAKTNQNDFFLVNNNETNETYEFSMLSLKFYKDFISVGDSVKFQLASNPITKKKRAYNVEVIRERLKGTVLSLQRMYGFLKPDNLASTGNIYFNAAEIRSNVKIKSGDKVDFYLIKNKKTDKYYAIDIGKPEETFMAATDRTLFKNLIKSNQENNGPKVIVIRQPKAPDGSKGFGCYEDIDRQ